MKSLETEPESDSDMPWAMDKALATAPIRSRRRIRVGDGLGQQLVMAKGSGCSSH